MPSVGRVLSGWHNDLAVGQEKANEKHDREKDPAGRNMVMGDAIRESAIAENYHGGDSEGIAE